MKRKPSSSRGVTDEQNVGADSLTRIGSGGVQRSDRRITADFSLGHSGERARSDRSQAVLERRSVGGTRQFAALSRFYNGCAEALGAKTIKGEDR